MIDWEALRAPIPRDDVHWRCQTMTGDGTKGLALAYIDARDLMERLDAVCGPAGWKDAYTETAKGRVICTISLLVDGEWVSKSDGAGDTDVEGEKGAISDAFKRAGVKWGVARELYSLGNVWVPCESREKSGKRYWQKWTDDQWKYVRNVPPAAAAPRQNADAEAAAFHRHKVEQAIDQIEKAETEDALFKAWQAINAAAYPVSCDKRVIDAKDKRKADLTKAAA